MKAIMAEAQTSKVKSTKSLGPLPVLRVSSGDTNLSVRREASREQISNVRPSAVGLDRGKNLSQGATPSSSSSPWRLPQPAGSQPTTTPSTPMLSAIDKGSSALSSPRVKAEKSGSRMNTSPSGSPLLLPTTPQRQVSSQPGMGPVFTPTRQRPSSKASSTTIRRVGYVVSSLGSNCVLTIMHIPLEVAAFGPHHPCDPSFSPPHRRQGCRSLLFNN